MSLCFFKLEGGGVVGLIKNAQNDSRHELPTNINNNKEIRIIDKSFSAFCFVLNEVKYAESQTMRNIFNILITGTIHSGVLFL